MKKAARVKVVVWTALAGLLFAMLLAAVWLAVAVLQVKRAAGEARDLATDSATAHEPIIRSLGGPDRAAFKVGLYLRLPERIAPDKVYACLLLYYCGRSAEKALPALIAILDDMVQERDPERLQEEKAGLAMEAVEVCGQLGPAAKPAVPVLIRIMRRDAQVPIPVQENGQSWSMDAARALGRIGPAAAPAVPELRKALSDDMANTEAAKALGLIGPEARSAVPDLEAMIKRGDCQAEAALAIWRIDGNARRALGVLLPPAKAKRTLDWRTVQALGEMGPAAAPALPQLRKLLKPKPRGAGDWSMAIRAAEAVWKITGDAKEALPVLVAALGDFDQGVRGQALEVLAAMGPAAQEACPAVEKLVGDEQVGTSAREALRKIRSEAAGK
jgi:HEAT repeat protein